MKLGRGSGLRRHALLIVTALFLASGALVSLRAPAFGRLVWTLGVVLMGFPLVLRTTRDALRGRFATDIVASFSIVGAVALGQPLAGLVIVLMQAGGEALERYAEGRASAALQALEEAAPRIAHVERPGSAGVEDIAATQVVVGDTIVVRPGDILPCDGVVIDGESDVDASSLTGEPVPIRAAAGVRVMSGMINALGSFRYRATAIANESEYAQIVARVREAQGSKAPLQRLADQYAVWFTPVTLAVCAVAVAVSHDPLRALAILVVATPCPLILAAPVALIGGINRAARYRVIVRSGAALERLSSVDTAVFDKTGTLTVGKPRLHAIRTVATIGRADVLAAAASVEQRSSYLLGQVLVDAARSDGIRPQPVEKLKEAPGQGISAFVNGQRVTIGARSFVIPRTVDGATIAPQLESSDAALRTYVAFDDRFVAVIEFADELRPNLSALFMNLRTVGIDRFVLLSGDHGPVVRAIAERIGIPDARGDLLPGDKVNAIAQLQQEGRTVMMIGDGINDAPALAVADVGVALASYGAGIAAESADAVILADSIDHVFDGIQIARRSMHIARQSITVGLGLSAIAMVAAGLGLLAPVVGAAVQEAIDVAVILNALRAARNPRGAKNETASGAPWAPAASRASIRENNHVSTLRA